MKSFIILLLPIGLGLVGCSTLPNREPLSISKIETIDYGTTPVSTVASVLGKPDEVTPTKDGNEIWTYREADSTGYRGQRLNVRVERPSSRIISATWIPFQGETLISKEGVFERFKNANFLKKSAGWDSKQRHHFSNDEIYSDVHLGISFYLNTHDNTVADVSFKRPLPSRTIGTAGKSTEQK